jgi:hypothetical protein
MNFIEATLSIALAASSGFSIAGDITLDLNVASVHVDSQSYYTGNGREKRAYNGVNRGLGLTLGIHSNVSTTAGFYKNSIHNNSLYLGAKFHTDNPTFNASTTFSVVTGYLAPVQMVMLPAVSATFGGVTGSVGLIPSGLVNKSGSSAITLQVGIKLN